jgi:hypothetical protein
VEVHRRAAGCDIPMQLRVSRDVGGRVGNSNKQGPAIVGDLGVKGVVDILGFSRIDLNELEIFQVPAAFGFQWLALSKLFLQLFTTGRPPLH